MTSYKIWEENVPWPALVLSVPDMRTALIMYGYYWLAQDLVDEDLILNTMEYGLDVLMLNVDTNALAYLTIKVSRSYQFNI